ncbi:MAG: SUMF1/EgtB/PvdO family nonheme iron enzyme [Thermoguttaceae bacterium]|nr:SUMF1/EgtB/PvdO family nonheme iron enzyme [Thermoguttaceae bacterium]
MKALRPIHDSERRNLSVFPAIAAFLLVWTAGVFGISETFAAEESSPALPKAALLTDQPCGLVPDLETSFALETAARLKSVSVLPVYPAERGLEAGSLASASDFAAGSAVSFEGKPVNLADFPVLWIHQGDEAGAEGPLYSEAWGQTIQTLARMDSPRLILLSGGAPRLLKSAGIADVVSADMTIMNDRFQAGFIPVGEAGPDSLWNGLTEDRGVFWFTNAVYSAFQSLKVQPLPGPAGNDSENAGKPGNDSAVLPEAEIFIAANVPGGPYHPFYAVRYGKCVFFVLSWNFSQLYDHAAPEFRNNLERFLANILSWRNTPESFHALVTPSVRKRSFPVAPLKNMMAAYREKTGKEYPNQKDFEARLTVFEKANSALENGAEVPAENASKNAADFEELKRAILLAHPELDFDRFLFVRRKGASLNLPHNYNSNCVLALPGASKSNSALDRNWENSLCEMNIRTGEIKTLFVSPNNFWLGDLELHFDAEKVLFSMPSPNMAQPRWRIWELPLPKAGQSDVSESATGEISMPDGASFAENRAPDWNARAVQIPTVPDEDVDDYDACYLPDGGLVFCSTACFTGVPCINGSGHVCNLYRKDASGKISQLTVEQDHDWNPVLLPNGRILYLRWEYSDLPHAFSRILMHANPDGTNQTEYYGSGSYYPNTMFYARPIPNSSKFSAIVSGHHELPRIGDLVIFDPSRGRKEAEGAVQRIPGAGKPVSPVMLDFPIAQTWPKFSQPFPISETMFLTACQLNASSPWSIYLVDTFDNMLEIARPNSDEGMSVTFQEPTPIRKTPRPPVLPDRTDWNRQDADVFIADIYYGQGLPNVPRGTVKALRLFTYEFAYQGMGAEPHSVGLDGPWDPKRVLGTVPVYEDGSASFRMPANTPIAFQALDAQGREIQLMRSWTTAMPGESVSCTGCHEEQNSVPPAMPLPIASRRPPVDITPDFQIPPAALTAFDPSKPITPELLKAQREGIDDFLKNSGSSFADRVRGFSFQQQIQPILEKHCLKCHDQDAPENLRAEPSFRNGVPVPAMEGGNSYNTLSRFSPSYYNLRRYVRTPTKESQMPVLKPYEFHVESTILGQILRQGHHDVQLSDADWARLNTWIDLNCPYYGSWGESRNYQIATLVKHQYERRLALRKLYTPSVKSDADDPAEFAVPEPAPGEIVKPPHKDILFERTKPVAALENDAPETELKVELAPGILLELARIPGTKYLIGQFEITNEQFRLFDPKHHSGWEYADFIHFSPNEAAWLLSRDRQPVVRVSLQEAEAFCQWLTKKTGLKFTLPTAEEWRTAAMAGENESGQDTSKAFWFGDQNVDFSRFENLSDISNQKINPRSWSGRVGALPPWRIADGNVNDRSRVSAFVGSYRPNPWGLFDVHGNVSEWVSTPAEDGSAMALGGSWYLPSRFAGIRSERHFTHGQAVFDVGFRVKCELP